MRLIFLLVLLSTLSGKAQISGSVLDEHKESLPGAVLLSLPDSTKTITDQAGKFSFQKTPQILISRYIGYKSDTTFIDDKNNQAYITIQMLPDNSVLGTVVITEEHAKQEETLQTEHVHEDFFHKNMGGTFAKSLEKISGVNVINVGVGISKPVIRGLSSNRIIVNSQGIKQESQQWGSDHGLEIDQFDVERVEVIKGPSSLQYGSDGLGGVINIMPDKLLPKNSIAGSVLGIYKTNNLHWGGSSKFGININNWFLTARYSRQDFADYQVPGNTFIYNGFELPILNKRLKNTAGDESNISVSSGIVRDWGVTRMHFSHYSLNAGLFSGAVGVPRSYALDDDGNVRDYDVPSQMVDHYKVALHQTLLFGDNHLVLDAGYQRNIRNEFSQPEFHSIPFSQLEDPNDKLALKLALETYSISSHYEYQIRSKLKNIIGGNVQWQNNQRGGFEYLLPNFRTFRGGLYIIMEKEINEHWLVNGGARFDFAKNITDYYRQFVWDSNENIIDSLVSIPTDDSYFNWSASLGTNVEIREGAWIIKANLGKSFRVPHPAETVSNGIHHGTFRHEVGTADLSSEHGYQLDLGGYWHFPKFNGKLSTYLNYFDNYIYLGPTFPARFSRLPEAGQVFQYRQDDAIYSGFELEWGWNVLSQLNLNQSVDFVQSYNPETGLALPFTPQPSIRTSLNFSSDIKSWLKNTYVDLEHQYSFAAKGGLRIDRSEKPTPAYQLVNLKIGTDLEFGGYKFNVRFQIQNLFDTKYYAHLSRYRIINIPEQGRNVVFSIKIPFDHALK